MRIDHPARWLCLCAAALLALTACIDDAKDLLDGDDDGKGAEAYASADLTRAEAALALVAADNVDPMAEPATNAETLAAATATLFTPADCATAQTVDRSVTWELNGCSGAYGLSNVSGTVVLVFTSEGSSGLSMNVTGEGLQAGSAQLTLNLDAAISTDAEGLRTLAVQTRGGGQAPDGTILTRLGSYTARQADTTSDCIALDGTWTTTLGQADDTWTTTVTDVTVCGNQCPDAGNLTFVKSDSGDTLLIQFDGSNRPLFTRGDAVPSTLELSCQPSS